MGENLKEDIDFDNAQVGYENKTEEQVFLVGRLNTNIKLLKLFQVTVHLSLEHVDGLTPIWMLMIGY